MLILDGHAAIGLAAASIGEPSSLVAAAPHRGRRQWIERAEWLIPQAAPTDSLLQRLVSAGTPANPVTSSVRNLQARPRRELTPLRRVALIAIHCLARRGIASFTTDLERAISNSRPDLEVSIVAMNDTDRPTTIPLPSSCRSRMTP